MGYREENKASHQNISSLFPILCFAGYNFDFVYPPPLFFLLFHSIISFISSTISCKSKEHTSFFISTIWFFSYDINAKGKMKAGTKILRKVPLVPYDQDLLVESHQRNTQEGMKNL